MKITRHALDVQVGGGQLTFKLLVRDEYDKVQIGTRDVAINLPTSPGAVTTAVEAAVALIFRTALTDGTPAEKLATILRWLNETQEV